MKIIESIEEMREYSQQLKREGKTISSVDTEGYLHDGHMSLVKIAKDIGTNTVVSAVSIFPLNFSLEWPENYKEELIKQEDLYQNTFLKKDLELCRIHNVDVFFHPSMLDYYKNPIQTISISHVINRRLLHNPNTFGLGAFLNYAFDLTIKNWNIICPDITIFGQKDIHQAILIKKTANVLLFPIKIIIAPTIRDSNGLAFSSRNILLSKSERQNASSVYQSLQEVSAWPVYPLTQRIKIYINERITRNNGSVYYVDICCAETLKELDVIDKETVIVVAAKFGEVDIWDNIIIKPK